MNEYNAILLSKINREDGYAWGGIVLKVRNTCASDSAYNELKEQLLHPDIIGKVVKMHDLMSKSFGGDETYLNKVSTEYRGMLCYIFENDNGEVVQLSLTMDFVFVDEVQQRKDMKRAFMYGHDLCKDKPYPLYAEEFDNWYEKVFLGKGEIAETNNKIRT